MPASTTRTPVSLTWVLGYRHPAVVRRYAQEHHASTREAETVFREMLKWLYLCYRSTTDAPRGFAVSMTPELEKIDWMWHTFILFTRDYAAFCQKYFGVFVHHVPETEDAEEEVDADALRARLETQFTLVYNVLGAATLRSWYDQCRFASKRYPRVERN